MLNSQTSGLWRTESDILRFTDIDIDFDVRYESHQNCPKILSMNILRVFSDHDLWHQNWCQYVWTSLCQFNFFVNFLHSLGVWFFDTWHLFDNLTSFDILTHYLASTPLPMCPKPLYPIAHCAPLPMCPIPHVPIAPCVHVPHIPVPHCPCAPYPCNPLSMCPIPLYPIAHVSHTPVSHTCCNHYPLYPITHVPHCPCGLYPLYPIPPYTIAPCAPLPMYPIPPVHYCSIAHVPHHPCPPLGNGPHGEWAMGYREYGPHGEWGTGGNGVQGLWGTSAMGTWTKGHRGWATWAMGHMDNGIKSNEVGTGGMGYMGNEAHRGKGYRKYGV